MKGKSENPVNLIFRTVPKPLRYSPNYAWIRIQSVLDCCTMSSKIPVSLAKSCKSGSVLTSQILLRVSQRLDNIDRVLPPRLPERPPQLRSVCIENARRKPTENSS